MSSKLADGLVKTLEKMQEPPKHRFTNIEVILIAYFAYWTVIIGLPHPSFIVYDIYDELSKIITEHGLIFVTGFMAVILFLGCFTGIKWLRLTALMLSVTVWSVIALSLMQANLGSMRGSVIILAFASAYQFIHIAKQRRAKC